MNARERVYAALDFRPPDIVPVEYHPSPAGLYEHGEKLKDLWRSYPQDFGNLSDLPILGPGTEDVGPDGSYRALRRDEWGVVWEEAVFGIRGHPYERPLDDLDKLDGYMPPQPPSLTGPTFEADKRSAAKHMEQYFLKSGWISIFEVMHALRQFEDVLTEVALDTPDINRIADMIQEYQGQVIKYLLARGVDAIQFGDDFGTQSGMMISPALWRRFFKPRYEALIAPILEAGVKAFFHCCGCVWELFGDLADLGVHAVWPQVNLYDADALARRCRELNLAVEIHPERSHLMTRGTPKEIEEAIDRLVEIFRPQGGGSWFYVEIDNGFPFDNVKALFEVIGKYR